MSGQRKAEKKAREDLKADFVEKSKGTTKLKQTNPDWLWDRHVREFRDLESYSQKSGDSDLNIRKLVRHGEAVGFAASEGSGACLDATDVTVSESSEWSDSDFEKE